MAPGVSSPCLSSKIRAPYYEVVREGTECNRNGVVSLMHINATGTKIRACFQTRAVQIYTGRCAAACLSGFSDFRQGEILHPLKVANEHEQNGTDRVQQLTSAAFG